MMDIIYPHLQSVRFMWRKNICQDSQANENIFFLTYIPKGSDILLYINEDVSQTKISLGNSTYLHFVDKQLFITFTYDKNVFYNRKKLDQNCSRTQLSK